jgi:hypothetical protein
MVCNKKRGRETTTIEKRDKFYFNPRETISGENNCLWEV